MILASSVLPLSEASFVGVRLCEFEREACYSDLGIHWFVSKAILKCPWFCLHCTSPIKRISSLFLSLDECSKLSWEPWHPSHHVILSVIQSGKKYTLLWVVRALSLAVNDSSECSESVGSFPPTQKAFEDVFVNVYCQRVAVHVPRPPVPLMLPSNLG